MTPLRALWLLLTGLVVGWLVGADLGYDLAERRVINCTRWCQRAAGREYGDADCHCVGDVRAVVDRLDHPDTGFPTRSTP